MRLSCTGFILRASACLLLCAVLFGCNRQEPTEAPRKEQHVRRTLTIGLIPEHDIFSQKKRYQPLLDHLSKRLGVHIESAVLTRYGNIIDNFEELGLDGAFFGSFTGALAIEKLGVEPLARPQYENGASTYYGMVFVKKGSGIRTAADMRGKRMVFVDRSTTAGYLLPLAYFKSLGITDYEHWFRESYFSGTHEDAINDVLNDVADIGAAKNTVFYTLAARDKRVTTELDILATSPHVPANGLAVRSDLEKELKDGLKRELLALQEDSDGRQILEEMKITRFIETTARDYQPVLDYAAGIGLDLKSYAYRNN